MPNVTFFVSEETPLSAALRSDLSADAARLCRSILQADLDKIHVCYVAATVTTGHPIYVEIKIRQQDSRPPDVLDAFVNGIAEAVQTHTGRTARVRCFAFPGPCISAKN